MANELSLNQTVQGEVGEFNYLYVNGEEITGNGSGTDLDLIFDPDSDDHTQSIIDALTEATTTGRTLRVRAGTYIIKTPILINLINSLKVVCDPAVIFKVHSEFPQNQKVFQFLRDEALNGVMFDWYGSEIDGSEMPVKTGGAPDLMSIESRKIKDVTIKSVFFKANVRTNGTLGTRGDSCLFIARGENYLITECTFTGAVDACIYVSGTSSQPYAGKQCIITDNVFADYHEVGVISKREFQTHIISNNIFDVGENGITIGGEATDNGLKRLPGSRATITGNILTNIRLQAIALRRSDFSIISNNKIRALGSTNNSAGIKVGGSSYCVVNGNTIESLIDDNFEHGIFVVGFTFDGTTYQSNHNNITGNIITGCAIGIEEGANSNYTIITDNQLDQNPETIRLNSSGLSFADEIDFSEGTASWRWGYTSTPPLYLATPREDRAEGVYLGTDLYDKNGQIISGGSGGFQIDPSVVNDLSTTVQALQTRTGTLESLIGLLTNNNTNDTDIEHRITRLEKTILALKAIHDAKKSVYNIPLDW